MIKSLYDHKNEINDTNINKNYEAVKDEASDIIRNKYSILMSLTSEDRRNSIETLIWDHLVIKRPIVSKYVYNGSMDYSRLAKDIYRDLHEYSFLTDILNNPGDFVNIECFGCGKGNLFGTRNGKIEPLYDLNGNELYFKDPDDIDMIINKLSSTTNERMTESNTIIRCKTLQGHRLSAQHRRISGSYMNSEKKLQSDPQFSIRLNQEVGLSIKQLIEDKKTMTMSMLNGLKALLYLPVYHIYFSGIPGSGKTTLMNALSYEVPELTKMYLSRVQEAVPNRRDENGQLLQKMRTLIATDDEEDEFRSNGTTLKDIFQASLSSMVDITIIGEAIKVSEMNVVLECATASRTVWTTLHGSDEATTLERFIKNTMIAKSVSREDALQEALLSLNLIVGPYNQYTDRKIRVSYISEVLKVEDEFGHIRPKFNRLYEYRVLNSEINQVTGEITGAFYKVGVPSKNLEKRLRESRVDKKYIEELMRPCSMDKPINLSEEGNCFVY